MIPEIYTVEYDANGGASAPENQSKTADVDLTLSTVSPIRDGYTFMGWATTPEGEVMYVLGATYSVNSNVTLYAVWEQNLIYGDVNSDGDVNIKDAVLLAQLLAGWTVQVNNTAADCTNDGDINTKDAVLLAQKLAGWNVEFPGASKKRIEDMIK